MSCIVSVDQSNDRRRFHYNDPLSTGDIVGLSITGLVAFITTINFLMNVRGVMSSGEVEKHKDEKIYYREKYNSLRAAIELRDLGTVSSEILPSYDFACREKNPDGISKVEFKAQTKLIRAVAGAKIYRRLRYLTSDELRHFSSAWRILHSGGERLLQKLLDERYGQGKSPKGWVKSFFSTPPKFCPDAYIFVVVGLYRQLHEEKHLPPLAVREKYPIGLPKNCAITGNCNSCSSSNLNARGKSKKVSRLGLYRKKTKGQKRGNISGNTAILTEQYLMNT